jgi:hypothetical protein
MKLTSAQWVVIAAGTALVIVLVLFPEWRAVHPGDANLSRSLGFGWILSPLPPPESFPNMRVERTSFTLLLAVIVAVASLAVCLALSISNKQE